MNGMLFFTYICGMVRFIVVCVVILLAVLGRDYVAGTADEGVQLYLDVQQVNTSESLKRIAELPIVYYKFLHDTVPDRIQLGAIGPEAQRLFPESIEVLPSATFTNMSALSAGGRISTYSIRNFPIVDKNVLFMHGVAALQELIGRYESLERLVSNLSERDKTVYDDIRKAQEALQQSINQQLANKLRTLELEASTLEAKLEMEKDREAEETRKLQARLQAEQSLLELEEKLSRERLEQQEQSVRATVAQQLEMERDLALRKDAVQRENEAKLHLVRDNQRQHLESKRLEYEKEKIRAEMDARAAQEKMNEEIQIKKIQLQAKLETERMVQGIKSVSGQISSMIQRLFAHPEQLLLVSGMFLAIVFCYYLIRELSGLLRQWIQTKLGRPVLVRETSYQWSILPSFLSGLFSFSWLSGTVGGKQSFQSWSSNQTMASLSKEFEDIILSDEDKDRILQLALATRNTKRSMAPYRHVLLHGPPGTGKTLIARRLAACSEMDYAILSGGDVAPLGEDAVNQLHALFQWAQKSRRGLLVFIDEAEAFLCSRTASNDVSSMTNADEASASAASSGPSSNLASQSMHLRNALNALLYQTGTPSRSFMMVLATNRPQDLDAAVLDRIDVSLHIGLPQPAQRAQLIKLYMQVHVIDAVEAAMQTFFQRLFANRKKSNGVSNANPDQSVSKFVEDTCWSEMAMQEMIRMTRGFSGREISKLFISVQYVLLLSRERQLTWSMLKETVRNKAEEHRMKMAGFVTVNKLKRGVDVYELQGDEPEEEEEEKRVYAGMKDDDESVSYPENLKEEDPETKKTVKSRKSLSSTTRKSTSTSVNRGRGKITEANLNQFQ